MAVMMAAMSVVMVMAMLMVMMMAGVGIAIGTAFRIERLNDQLGLGAEMLQHVFNDVITPDQNAIPVDLGFKVPVAQVPGQQQQVMRVLGAHGHERFRLGCDLDDAAVLKPQPVTMGKLHRLGKVEQK